MFHKREEAMDLYVLRHGIAVERGTAGYDVDAERPLTADGKKKMRQIANAMKAMDLSFDLILSSPYVRAKQTAEIVAGVLMVEKNLELSLNLEPEGSFQHLVNELRECYATRRSVLLIGHEPQMSQAISIFLAGTDGVLIVMKKGGLCKLKINDLIPGRCAELDWFLTPRQLRRIK